MKAVNLVQSNSVCKSTVSMDAFFLVFRRSAHQRSGDYRNNEVRVFCFVLVFVCLFICFCLFVCLLLLGFFVVFFFLRL